MNPRIRHNHANVILGHTLVNTIVLQSDVVEVQRVVVQYYQLPIENMEIIFLLSYSNPFFFNSNKRLQVAYTHAHAYMWPSVPQGGQ